MIPLLIICCKTKNSILHCHLEIPEFELMLGCELIRQFKDTATNSQNLLKDIFYKLMTLEKEIICQNIKSHKKKLQSLCK